VTPVGAIVHQSVIPPYACSVDRYYYYYYYCLLLGRSVHQFIPTTYVSAKSRNRTFCYMYHVVSSGTSYRDRLDFPSFVCGLYSSSSTEPIIPRPKRRLRSGGHRRLEANPAANFAFGLFVAGSHFANRGIPRNMGIQK
jgi:hypothetical protein